MKQPLTLDEDRCFNPEPQQRALARRLYDGVKTMPLVCPHGHVDPAWLADENWRFGSPADLFIIPDHYVVRMLYSQGVPMEELGVARRDGGAVETDHRRIWGRFADHWHLFRGTPTGLWLHDELANVFGVEEKLTSANAQAVYDQVAHCLTQPEWTPRALFRRFNIEVLCTTDAATSTLPHHRTLRDAGIAVRPTFRPDAVVNLVAPQWHAEIARLGDVSGVDVVDYRTYIAALEQRRTFFKQMGATATDHGTFSPHAERMSDHDATQVFDAALRGHADERSAARFNAHMLVEMARMSVEDGLVMQLHAGSFRNHNTPIFERWGADVGADIPVATDWTRGLRALLNDYGNDSRFRLILFTLDESTYSRELAPLAGHYPAVLLGPPWWFHDSVNGMRRFFDRVIETAGLYNTAGFNDDTRAFASIPARHDVWRRVSCDWLAGLVLQGMIDEEDATAMANDCAVGLARRAYRL
jgi:glucuronate isomerase